MAVGFGSAGSSCMIDPTVHGDKLLHDAFTTSQGAFWEEEEKVLEDHVICPVCLRAPRFTLELHPERFWK